MTVQIIQIASLITALGVILGVLFKVKKYVDDLDKSRKEIKDIKKEQRLMFSAMFACLDGLEQLGANHTVPKAKKDLEDWLNDQAHE